MTRTLLCLASMAALAACASAPAESPAHPAAEPVAAVAAPSRDCTQIGAQIVKTQAERRDAQAREQDAWKVFFPVAVAAKVARSKSAVDAADRRLEELHADAERQGCAL
jgi:hypothetical protein